MFSKSYVSARGKSVDVSHTSTQTTTGMFSSPSVGHELVDGTMDGCDEVLILAADISFICGQSIGSSEVGKVQIPTI